VVLDTGTSIGLVPDDRLQAFYSQVTGAVNNATAGGWTLPCSSTPPTLTLGVSTYRITLPSADLIYAPVEDGSETCFGSLQSNAGLPFMVWGDAILKAQFIVFGLDGPNGGAQLGFANKPLEQ
jgi:aspergillopepsin I